MKGKDRERVLVVGGGAAGMMAAISARRLGAAVTVVERNPRVGKKLLATGNGRCNFTNINASLPNYFGEDPNFAAGALARFSPAETIRFFEKLGVAHKVEDEGKVFPRSDQASSVLDLLRFELEGAGVELLVDAMVEGISRRGRSFWLSLADGRQLEGERVILACGGKALPSSGSDGRGYRLAASLGHQIVEPLPALVQLKLQGDFFKQIDGVKVVGSAAVLVDGEKLVSSRGDLLFTVYGISGPPVLQVSRWAIKALAAGKSPWLQVGLLDQFSLEEIDHLLAKRFNNQPERPLSLSLIGLLNKRLIPVIWREAGIGDLNRPAHTLQNNERRRLAGLLRDWRLPVKGSTSWPHAQVTAGGVATDEINPATMGSRLVPGLYFAGEMVDIDGACGGFNLQWAWSSGYLAGESAARGL